MRAEATSLGRRVFKRELGVSGFLDLDHQRRSSFVAAKWERLTCVLVRDGVDVLAIAIFGYSGFETQPQLPLLILTARALLFPRCAC